MTISIGTWARRAVLGPVLQSAVLYEGRRWSAFRRSCQDCRRKQQATLLRIVANGAATEFGRMHGLHKVRSYSDFRSALPITQWPYFAPYVEMCKEGHCEALIGLKDRLVMFATTSGTTGPCKAIPVTCAGLSGYRRGWTVWGIKLIRDHPGPLTRLVLHITGVAQECLTPSGLPVGSISGLLARNQHPLARSMYAVPHPVMEITDPDLRYYTIMRMAIPEDVGLVVTANPGTLVMLAKTADRYAQALIKDIRDGTLFCLEQLRPPIRDALAGRLRPHRPCAGQLEWVLDTHGHLYPRYFWDRPVLAHWTGGTLGLYAEQVRRYYGDTPVRDIGLIASEARMSIPVEDGTPSGVLEIESTFFEFIPEQEIDAADLAPDAPVLPAGLTVLRAEELELGHRYYIVLTNRSGLYRYHIGDIVRVTGWTGTTPVIEFLSRGMHTSSLAGEKLTEYQVVSAVDAAVRELGLGPDCYVLAPVWSDPPYYRLLIEAGSGVGPDAVRILESLLDRNLAMANCEYATKRASGRLGMVQVVSCTDGRLSKADCELIRTRPGRSDQFKHRILLNTPIREPRSSGYTDGPEIQG